MSKELPSNRLAGRIALPTATPPDVRVRIRPCRLRGHPYAGSPAPPLDAGRQFGAFTLRPR
jgi:hypothetical protein